MDETMDQRICFISGGGLTVRYFLLYPETRRFFGRYLKEGNICKDDPADPSQMHVISVSPEYMEDNRWLVDEKELSLPFLEFQALMLKTGNELLLHDRALFHGAALLWKDRAWIFTAPSGTGKTTQLKHWQKILQQEVTIINGDKPLLECRCGGDIWVHSSPWRGKERYGKPGVNGKLGGIILLRQGKENKIRRIDPKDAVLPLFTEFVSFPEDTRQLECQAQILDQILDAVPVWELVNKGNPASARLTIGIIGRYLEESEND